MKKICIAVLVLCATILVPVSIPVPVAGEYPCILIDTGHGGYPVTEGILTDFALCARKMGFHVLYESIAHTDCQDMSLILSVNPEFAFSSDEVTRIAANLENGGMFFLLGAGDYDNRDHSDVTNELLKELQSTIRCNDDQIADTVHCGKSYIPLFEQWNPHPLTAALPPMSLYSPESLHCGETAYPLLMGNSSSYRQDLDENPPLSTDAPIVVLAVEKIASGTLFVGGSWGFVAGPPYQGHQAFREAFLSYVYEGRSIISLYEEHFQGSTIQVGDTCRIEVDGKAAHIMESYLGLSSDDNVQSTVVIGGPQVNDMCRTFNQYLPVTFKKDDIWYLQCGKHQHRGTEYGLIACLWVEGQKVLIVAGLGGTGTMGAVKALTSLHRFTQIPIYNEYGEALIVQVKGDTNSNGIEESSESWEITLL